MKPSIFGQVFSVDAEDRTNAEHVLMILSDLHLARRLERAEGRSCAAFVDARARHSPQSGACHIEVAGALAMFDSPESPVTQCFGLGIFEPATADVLERVNTRMRERSAEERRRMPDPDDDRVLDPSSQRRRERTPRNRERMRFRDPAQRFSPARRERP